MNEKKNKEVKAESKAASKANEQVINELKEQVSKLTAERDMLNAKVSDLEDTKDRYFRYWQREEGKVATLLRLIKSGIKPGEYLNLAEIAEKIAESA